MADKAKDDAEVTMKLSDVSEAHRAAYVAALTATDSVQNTWDAVIRICAFCLTVGGKKIVDNDLRGECATEFALVSVDRDGIGPKSKDYPEAMTAARRQFSARVLERMRPGAKVRRKKGAKLEAIAGPFAGWAKESGKRSAKSAKTDATGATVAAISVPVATLRPLVGSALNACIDVNALLAEFGKLGKLDKAQTAGLQLIVDHATVTFNRVKAIADTLPPVTLDEVTRPPAPQPEAPQPEAPKGNGSVQPQA